MGLLIHKLKKTYVGPDGSSVPVIDIPELYLADGEQVALIGTSGSGKTTLLHMIAGILVGRQRQHRFRFRSEQTRCRGVHRFDDAFRSRSAMYSAGETSATSSRRTIFCRDSRRWRTCCWG